MPESSIALLEYDVAFSYASEDRPYVRAVAERLHAQGIRVFYDEFATTELWGAELPEIFLDIFHKKARFAVAFISAHYVSKPWPMHEGRNALARALVEHGTYFLPVRLDDSELPGLRPTIGYIDARVTSPEQLSAMILEKLGAVPGGTATDATLIKASAESPDEVRSAERDAAVIGAVTQGDELYIVMDLGGTKAYVSLMTREAKRLYDKKFTTESQNDVDGLLEFIRRCIRGPIDRIHELTGMKPADVEKRVKAIGIAFPGPTDFERGLVLDASNFNIKNFRLADKVHETFGIETFVDNDVNLGALGEAWKGAAVGYENVIGIMIGTGIGGGIIVNDQIYRGRNKSAGEIGHMILNLDSEMQCGCGQYGCFEALASRKSMARDLHKRKWEQGLRSRVWAEKNLLSNEIAMYYRYGDADAMAVVNRAAEICGKAVFSLLNLFNPQIIVFNGGFVQQLGEIFLAPVREEAKKCMNAVYSLADNRIPIALGKLSNPVLFGACKMAIEGSGGKVERSRQQIIAAITGGELNEDDRLLLEELYVHGAPVAINRHSDGDYSEDKLRALRNRGLVRTGNGLSFRRADGVEITDLGKVVVEEVLRRRSVV
jgi:glucokinase